MMWGKHKECSIWRTKSRSRKLMWFGNYWTLYAALGFWRFRLVMKPGY